MISATHASATLCWPIKRSGIDAPHEDVVTPSFVTGYVMAPPNAHDAFHAPGAADTSRTLRRIRLARFASAKIFGGRLGNGTRGGLLGPKKGRKHERGEAKQGMAHGSAAPS